MAITNARTCVICSRFSVSASMIEIKRLFRADLTTGCVMTDDDWLTTVPVFFVFFVLFFFSCSISAVRGGWVCVCPVCAEIKRDLISSFLAGQCCVSCQKLIIKHTRSLFLSLSRSISSLSLERSFSIFLAQQKHYQRITMDSQNRKLKLMFVNFAEVQNQFNFNIRWMFDISNQTTHSII